MKQKIPAPQSFILQPPDLGEFDEVAPNLFVYFGVSNSGIIITDEGIVIVDAQTSPGAAQLLYSKITKITDKPIKYVINTHYHGDHTYGNITWAKLGVPIVALHLTAELMRLRERRMKMFYRGRGLPADEVTVFEPTVLFEEQMTINIGGKALRLMHLGPGETEDGIVVLLEKERILFSNDTMHCYGFPIFGQPGTNEGLDSDGRFLATLSKYESLGAELVIPGHGHPTDNSSISKMKEIGHFFLTEVNERYLAGESFYQILKGVSESVPSEYKQMPPIWGNIDAAVRRVYYSIAGWLPYRPSAIPSAPEKNLMEIIGSPGTESNKNILRTAETLGPEKLAESLGLCEYVLKIDHENAEAFALRSEILIDSSSRLTSLFDRGEYLHAASESLRQALQNDPNESVAKMNLGMLLIFGVPIFGNSPNDGIVMLEALLAKGDLNKVRQAKAHYALGLGYLMLEDRVKAQYHLSESLRLLPTLSEAKMLLARLVKN